MIDGARLKALREEAGLTAAQLGECVGVTASAILHTERGFNKLGLNTFTLVAKKLGVPLDELVVRGTADYLVTGQNDLMPN